VITRALGVVPGVEPDVSSLRVAPGDLFVVCSDGVSSQMSDGELGERVEKRRDLASAAAGLIELANERGGDDNATAILVRLDG
jgi:protein phosphatase